MKKLYGFFIVLSLLLLLLSGITIRIEEYGFLSNIFFLVSGFILIILTFLYSRDLVMKVDTLIIVYFLFILIGFISALKNQDFYSFLSIVKLLFLYMFTITLMFNNFKYISINSVLFTFIASFIIIIYFSLKDHPLNQRVSVYSGLFDNPNSMGVFAATLFSVSFVLILINEKKVVRIFSLLMLVSGIYFIMISGSRTSFLTVCIVVLIWIVSYVITLIKEKRLRTRLLKWIFPSILIVLFCSILFFESELFVDFQENIIDKFDEKTGNITSSRTSIWLYIINEAGLFGQGAHHLKQETGLSAHNSFLSIIIEYGWLTGLFYILFWIVAIVKSYLFFLRSDSSKYSLLPIILISNYILLSTMEVLTVHVSAILAMFIVGYLTFAERNFIGKINI